MKEIIVKMGLDTKTGQVVQVGSNVPNKHMLVGLLFEAAKVVCDMGPPPDGAIAVPSPAIREALLKT